METPHDEFDRAPITNLSNRVETLEGLLDYHLIHISSLDDRDAAALQQELPPGMQKVIELPRMLETQLVRKESFHLTLSTSDARHIIVSLADLGLLLHARLDRSEADFTAACAHISRIQEWASEIR